MDVPSRNGLHAMVAPLIPALRRVAVEDHEVPGFRRAAVHVCRGLFKAVSDGPVKPSALMEDLAFDDEALRPATGEARGPLRAAAAEAEGAPAVSIVWLASYPKSGNTWLRVVLTNYLRDDGEPTSINALADGLLDTRHLCSVTLPWTLQPLERRKPHGGERFRHSTVVRIRPKSSEAIRIIP